MSQYFAEKSIQHCGKGLESKRETGICPTSYENIGKYPTNNVGICPAWLRSGINRRV